MGYFTVNAKNNLATMNLNDRLEESDFSCLTPDGQFVQLKYHEADDTKKEKYLVKPGVWSIQKSMTGLFLQETSFTKDTILSDFVHTKNISDKISAFFNKLDVYKHFGIEVPKRGMLLYGEPGSGKSTTINKVCTEYSQDKHTAVIIWPTDKFEAYEVKDFIQTFKYEEVTKLILVVEDIGGVEVDQVRMKSDSSLLGLLDNQEKTFTIATFIIATTNFPEVFLGNLTNRPGRFDDKVEVGYPPAEARAALLQFFSKDLATAAQIALIKDTKYNEFSPAHIKEAFIRSAIYDKTLENVLAEMRKEIELYKKAFTKSKSMSMSMGSDDYS